MKLVPFACALAALAMFPVARAIPQNASSVPSFTGAQATKGQVVYNANCAMCHGADLAGVIGPALNGPGSKVQWESVSAIYGYMTVTMPVGNAGGLAQNEYANIMAFLLRAHGHKAGSAALTPSVAASSSAIIGPQ